MIGERELVLAFALVGVAGTVVSTRDEALDAFYRATGRGLAGAGYAPSAEGVPRVLILTEEVASMIEAEAREWQMGAEYPLIVEIPGLHGHLSGRKTLTESIREAIGIRV